MSRNSVIVVAAVVVVILAGGGYLIFSQVVPGGKAQNIDATVTGDQMSPSTISVHKGDKVTLSITADKKEEIHLHGYDIHFEIDKPGDKVTKTFTADKTGRFDIEIEQTGKQVGQLQVT
jgi:FtsP/CotA-like multicopper oxidase with cupredoxin domain